jgi:hypothetical protein
MSTHPFDLHQQRRGRRQAEVVVSRRVRAEVTVVGVRAERHRAGPDRALGVDPAAPGCLSNYKNYGQPDTTKQANFNQFAKAVMSHR